MPAYDFICSECGTTTERRFSMSDVPDRIICPACPVRINLAERVRCSGGAAVNTHPVTSSYPYVSNRLPFELDGCPTSGPLKKSVILNRQHEDRIFKTNGYVKQD